MKIAVFSDSHGNTKPMEKAVLEEQPDMVIHLGDCVKDAEELQKKFTHIPMKWVKGNRDLFSADIGKLIITACGKRIFITHGHNYGVKLGMASVIFAAREENANLLLFGHTHRALCDKAGELIVFNPGTAGAGINNSYGIVIIENGEISCKLVEIDKA